MNNWLNKTLKKLYRKIVPDAIQFELLRYRNYEQYITEKPRRKQRNQQRKEIIRFLRTELKSHKDSEKQNIVNFLKRNRFIILPYEFVKKYNRDNVVVYTDSNMKYVLHDNKRMYFPSNWTEGRVKGYYTWLLAEQDGDSPHHYETAGFHVRDEDIVADIGAAEGIFALSVVEKVKKIYLFECETAWSEALERTFEPWKDKVTIVNRYISDCTDNTSITLDEFLDGSKIDFIKGDIEGAEIKLLAGAKETLAKERNLRIVLCTYHRENDQRDLDRMLKESGFQTEFSKGFMIYINDKKLGPPYLRRALIRATKSEVLSSQPL